MEKDLICAAELAEKVCEERGSGEFMFHFACCILHFMEHLLLKALRLCISAVKKGKTGTANWK
jgi:hypothetical protein